MTFRDPAPPPKWRASCSQAKVCHTIQSPVQATKCADVKLIASGGKKNLMHQTEKKAQII